MRITYSANSIRQVVFAITLIGASLLNFQNAGAVSLSIDASVDNTLHRVWVVENGITTQTLDLNYSNWREATNFDISFDDTKHVELYFWTENSDPRGLPAARNPGGLLADFSSSDNRFDGIGTSSSWEVSLDMSLWGSSTEWGDNGDNSTIWWHNNQSKPVTDIDLSASWIWYSTNFLDIQPGVGDPVYFRYELTQVPEPATLTLLGAGLFGLLARKRKQAIGF